MEENKTEVTDELQELILQGYTTAEAVREITLSPEEKLKNDIDSTMDSVLSSVVNVASKNGATNYTIQMNLEFKKEVLAALRKNLDLLGFTLKYSADEENQFLDISWAE